MCGITGFFDPIIDVEGSFDLINRMCSSIKHRGPDQQGHFLDCSHQLALGHQRLSIQDISDAGKQPMESHCGRYVIVFNGEIYNFKELKKELNLCSSIAWRGHSDTEVLLELISSIGIEKALLKLNGMFVFAVYDIHANSLTFARDRFGEKPLYIFSSHDSLAFSSELKPIEFFSNNLTLNSEAVSAQLKYSYIPAPYTIYNEVFKLLPGHYLNVSLNNYHRVDYNCSSPYWTIEHTVARTATHRHSDISLEDSLNQSEKALRRSVKQRMVSDVPLGAFLSGGIDSTCIVALMQSESSNKIKTFSIGFNDKNYNEADHAKAVANILGTEHHELYLNPQDIIEYVPKLPEIYDEPFSDSSQLPTLMVSMFAKEHVTVALTGDSGDEVYCGYNRYVWGEKLNKSFSKMPLRLRKSAGSMAKKISPSTYDNVFNLLGKVNKSAFHYKSIGDKVHKFSKIMGFSDEQDLYRRLIATSENTLLSTEVFDISTPVSQAFSYPGLSIAEKMMWQDTIGYMQNDILTKVDRASMAVSLETRIPFLDNEVFEQAWSMPLAHKLHYGKTKFPLRSIIHKYIPDELIDRPKAGFGVPIYSWLRNELRDWAEELLKPESLSKSGLLDVNKIRHIWKLHLSGVKNMQYELWNVLMFQQWYMRKN